ncbi:MAG: DUF3570 domain-containing protein [Betaproteobacteria bacterium]|nr:DUF3570 domain-containing protein [Betaproteobacteria bacterium]
MAALALPGLLPGSANAESTPGGSMIGLRNLHYREHQPGLERIDVNSPSLVFMTPLAGEWVFSGTLVTDNLSGASPRYHTAISGASVMQDRRNASDLRLKRILNNGSVSFGLANSNENDYHSTALSIQGAVDSEDRNTTWQWGLGGARDTINPVNLAVRNEHKRSFDGLLGVVRVLTPADIAQLNLGYSAGHGYYSDPYKTFDNRPREHSQTTLTAKWNHHFSDSDGSSRLSYRYARDSYQVRSHTISEEYVQPVGNGWTLAPALRYYTQSAARFYADPNYNPVLGPPFLAGVSLRAHPILSLDQRLSAFGALTVEFKVSKQLGAEWSADLKLSRYQQRSSWRLFGNGSPGLAPLTANWVEAGIYRQW